MKIGIVKETFPGERRVAIVPQNVADLKKLGLDVVIESGAGSGAFISDNDYKKAGAEVVSKREEILKNVDIVCYVRGPGADKNNLNDLNVTKKGATIVGMMDPLSNPDIIQKVAKSGVTAFALEMMPRVTRAQSMDVLSSMATIAGYRAVIVAADIFSRIFPMLMTAAGTLLPAKVFIIGAGVAGLQAITVAKRLGASVEAYDVRPEVKEQVQSCGAKFIEFGLETKEASEKSGYAKAMSEEFYKKQREMMLKVIESSDIVITTAAVPGKKAPVLVTKEMVERMRPGSVVIDLAAEGGGNCELTSPGEITDHKGVKIVGLVNAPSNIPAHASQMYSNNIKNFLKIIVKDGQLNIDTADEIVKGTLVTQNSEIVNDMVKKVLAKS
jgi:NAD(P) transhydrogenase subunit alpha